MNRTIRNLVIAVPLATVGFTMVGTAAATAGPNDPNFPIAIPEKPKGPQDKAPVPPKPKQPQDKAPMPKDNGPKDKAPKPAAKPQPQGGAQAAAPVAKVEKADKVVVAEVISAKGSPDSIDRSDVLFFAGPAEATLEVAESDNGMDMTWLLIGGGLLTVSGVAFAARKRTSA